MRYNRGMTLRWFTACLCLLAIVAWAAGARAQETPDYDAARRHYLAGRAAHSAGDHDRAVREYILAYDITKDPALFKQIAMAYEAAGQKNEAAIYYRRYLAEGKAGADAGDVRARIATLEGKAPAQPEEPAPPPLPPEPPARPAASEPLPEPPSPPRAAMLDEPRGSWQRTAGWVSVGLAAVALTTGAVLATSSMSREEDLRRLIEFRDPVTGLPREYAGLVREDYEQKVDEGEKLSRYATISFIGAGALAGAAVIFFILDATRQVEQPGRARLVPTVGQGGFGLVLGWEL
jgi:tetratricopeptide (TPR) repeat protein